MSYIQIDIGPAREVAKGEPPTSKRGLKFNQLALEMYSKNINWENFVDADEVYATFYGGLVGNCRAKREEEDFTFEDVSDWVDDLTTEVKKQVMAAFKDSKKLKEALDRAGVKLAESEGEQLKKNET